MKRTLRRVLLGGSILCCGLPMAPVSIAQSAATISPAATPPALAVRDVPEVFFGTRVPDPYRALEDKTAPEVVQWMKAQDQHARDLLARIPGRAGLVERLLKYDAAVSARVVGVTRETGDLWLVMTPDPYKYPYKHPYKRSSQHNVRLTEIALPLAGSINLSDEESGISAGDPRLPGLVLDLQSWTRARQIYVIDASGRVRNSGLQPAGAFIDAGGVVAVANPRGSSVSGQDWYRAGFQATKPNSWKDFIACAEWLIAQRYTAPDKLSILGGSAGGILVGMAMAERPDLFASVVSSVGVLDMLRAELTPNGVPNIPEFGSLLWQAGSEGYQLK